jgi:hypothetical protein
MALTLTIAVAVAILVPALVGYWRDPRRGVLSLAGTLLGATLAQFWAARWGAELAGSGVDAGAATFVLSCTLLVASALLIGYGSGVLLPPAPARAPLPRRLLGVLLGLLNGGLLAGYTLRYAAAASPGFAEELLTIPLAEAVHNGLPLFFLGLAVVLAAMIITRRAVQLMRRPRPATPMAAPVATPPAPAAGGTAQGEWGGRSECVAPRRPTQPA